MKQTGPKPKGTPPAVSGSSEQHPAFRSRRTLVENQVRDATLASDGETQPGATHPAPVQQYQLPLAPPRIIKRGLIDPVRDDQEGELEGRVPRGVACAEPPSALYEPGHPVGSSHWG